MATATPAGYAACKEENESLLSMFEVLELGEPSEDETVRILGRAKDAFESEHSVQINESAIQAAYYLAGGSGSDAGSAQGRGRALPGAALELLDRACAAAGLDNAASPQSANQAQVGEADVRRVLEETFPAPDISAKTSSNMLEEDEPEDQV